jgi:hypothetical protein
LMRKKKKEGKDLEEVKETWMRGRRCNRRGRKNKTWKRGNL